MNVLRKIGRRVRFLFREEQVEEELSDELLNHVAMEADELVRDGWDPDHAHREALRRFGGETRTKEQVRDARGGRLLADLVHDLRYAGRTLRKNPGFALSALLVLALGIGVSAAGLGVVRGVLIQPLPYTQPDELVRVWPTGEEFGDQPFSLPNFRDFAERSETLSSMGLYLVSSSGWTLGVDGEAAEELSTVQVAGDLFGTLAVPPALGRPITSEDVEGSSTVALLSDGAFRRLFGGDPGIVGRTVRLDFRNFEVIGVMPPGFSYPDAGVDVWVPVTTVDSRAFPYGERGMRWGSAVGRLAPGRTVTDAREELSRITADLAADFPENNVGLTEATVVGLRETIVGDIEVALWSLLAAVGFLLLLTIATVANLLIARGTGRGRELALRRGIGASFARVVRQLLTESALLALGGGLIGAMLCFLLLKLFAGNASDFVPRASAVEMDGVVLAGVLALSLLSACLAGAWPAVRIVDWADPGSALKGGAREIGSGSRGIRIRRALVAGQVALAVLLLVGSGLLLRSFEALVGVDPGFEPAGAAAMTVNVPFSGYAENRGWVTLHEEILARLRSLPGVESVGAIGYLPFRSEGEAWLLNAPTLAAGSIARVFPVTTDAFQALGVPLLQGRDFLESDGPDNVTVAVVNEAFVREWLPGEDPIGQRIVSGNTEWEVVGVVGDVLYSGLDQTVTPTLYSHIRQAPRSRQSYVVRTAGDPTRLFGAMRSVVTEVDPQLAVSEILPLSSLVSENSARPRFLTTLISGFAALALLLAALGIYGVLAYIVRGSAREMGLRTALGSPSSRIVAHVLMIGMRPAIGGLAAGLVGAALLSRYLQSLLFQVEPLDTTTFLIGGIVLALSAAIACLIPAIYAARVDPMVSLRAE